MVYTNSDVVYSIRTLAKWRMPFRLIPSLFSHLRNIVSSETQCTRVLEIIYRLNLGSYNSFSLVHFFFIVYCLVFQWFRFHFQTENSISALVLFLCLSLDNDYNSQKIAAIVIWSFCRHTERNIRSGLANRLCSTGAAFIRFWPLSIPDNKIEFETVWSAAYVLFLSVQNCIYTNCHGLQALVICKLFEFLLVQ